MARLEARRATEEDRLDAELAAGRSDRAAAMAEALAAAEPFRERRWGQLMLALYRSGRQAEACAASSWWATWPPRRAGRRPQPALRDLHRKILTHDPGLELADLPAPPGGGTPTRQSPAPRRVRPSPARSWATAPIDLVFLPGFTGHLEICWEDPTLSAASPPQPAGPARQARHRHVRPRGEAYLRSPSTWTTSSP